MAADYYSELENHFDSEAWLGDDQDGHSDDGGDIHSDIVGHQKQ